MATKNVTFTLTTDAPFKKVTVDGEQITFTNGVATVALDSPGEHSVNWFIQGKEDQKYEFEVKTIQPPKQIYNIKITLDDTGRDANNFWFKI
jgi:hypothetical protein